MERCKFGSRGVALWGLRKVKKNQNLTILKLKLIEFYLKYNFLLLFLELFPHSLSLDPDPNSMYLDYDQQHCETLFKTCPFLGFNLWLVSG